MAWISVNTRYSSLSQIYQLLLAIHLGIQPNIYTTYSNIKDFKEY